MPEPRPCAYCGTQDGHTPICWAITPAKHAGRIGVASGSTDGVPDDEACDRAEDSYQNMMMGEGPVGTW